MSKQTIRVAQISDCHLMGDPNQLMKGHDTENNLLSVLATLENNFDFLLLTGDIADEGDSRAYQRLAQRLDQLEIPCYFLPGNHDDLHNLNTYLKGKYLTSVKHFVMHNWQFILLNSTRPSCTEGYLSNEELNFLQRSLESHKNLFTVIAMHHHPITINSFMDEVMLMESPHFFKVIEPYQKIRSVLFGHIHQVIEELRGNTLFLSAPAIAYQMKPRAEKFALDSLTPGYRWLEFEYNGNIKTGISRLPMSKTHDTN